MNGDMHYVDTEDVISTYKRLELLKFYCPRGLNIDPNLFATQRFAVINGKLDCMFLYNSWKGREQVK
jgi:hypothetical protein